MKLLVDYGPGFPDPIKDKILSAGQEGFQALLTTKPTGQGTKLGLSLSFDIVKAHVGN